MSDQKKDATVKAIEFSSPYLIQRGKLKDVNPSEFTGIDSLISFDYMGSSEFEWGALPKAMKLIVGVLDRLAIEKSGVLLPDRRQIFLICLPEHLEKLKKFIHEEAEGKYHALKEWTAIDGVVKNTQPKEKPKVEFWWDLDNCWMATVGKPQAELVFQALIKVKDKKGW